jgi:hypothetical protein
MLKTVATAAIAGSLLCLVYGATGPPPIRRERQVLFTNEMREPIVELYAAAVGSGRWQGDLLGRDYLQPGASIAVDIDDDANCRVDLKIVLDDGSEMLRRSVDVCRPPEIAAALR